MKTEYPLVLQYDMPQFGVLRVALSPKIK